MMERKDNIDKVEEIKKDKNLSELLEETDKETDLKFCTALKDLLSYIQNIDIRDTKDESSF